MALGLRARARATACPRTSTCPYLAANIAEFWRRWHITLSRWLRDYLYIPLGGSRGGALRPRTATCCSRCCSAACGTAPPGLRRLGRVPRRCCSVSAPVVAPRRTWPRCLAPLGDGGHVPCVTLGWVLFRAHVDPRSGRDAAPHRRAARRALALGGSSKSCSAVVFVTVIAAHALSRTDATALARRLPAPLWGLAMAAGWVLAAAAVAGHGRALHLLPVLMRRPPQVRARAAVLWFLAWFLVLQLGVGAVLDALPAEVRIFELEGVMPALTAERAPDVVFFGSSRIAGLAVERAQEVLRQEAGDPRLTVRLAWLPAGSAGVAELVMADLVARGKQPAVAVLEISPEAVGSRPQWGPADLMRVYRLGDVLRYLPALLAAGHGSTVAGSRLIPAYRHRQQLWRAISQAAHVPVVTMGQPVAPAGPKPGVDAWQAMTGQHVRLLRDYRAEGPSAEATARFVALCRAHAITPVLLAVPASRPLRALYVPDVEQPFQAFVARLGVPLVDYRALVPDSQFRDLHHLDEEGGLLLADTVARDVLAPLWRAQRAGVGGTGRATNGGASSRAPR